MNEPDLTVANPDHARAMVERMVARFQEMAPALVEKMFELSMGVEVAATEGKSGYTTIPDRHAIEYLLNHTLGRPGVKDQRADAAFEGRVLLYVPLNDRDTPVGGAAADPGWRRRCNSCRRRRT